MTRGMASKAGGRSRRTCSICLRRVPLARVVYVYNAGEIGGPHPVCESCRTLPGWIARLPKIDPYEIELIRKRKRDERARARRLRALGNAVVPQVAELVGRRLIAIAAALEEGRDPADEEPTR